MDKKILTILVVLVVLVAGYFAFDTFKGEKIMTVNGVVITKKDFEKDFIKYSHEHHKYDKNKKEDVETKKYVINEMIVQSLINQEIKKRKIKATDSEVDAEIQKLINLKYGSKENLEKLLKERGETYEEFRSDRALFIRKAKVANVWGKELTDEEVEFYGNSKDNHNAKDASRDLLYYGAFWQKESVELEKFVEDAISRSNIKFLNPDYAIDKVYYNRNF